MTAGDGGDGHGFEGDGDGGGVRGPESVRHHDEHGSFTLVGGEADVAFVEELLAVLFVVERGDVVEGHAGFDGFTFAMITQYAALIGNGFQAHIQYSACADASQDNFKHLHDGGLFKFMHSNETNVSKTGGGIDWARITIMKIVTFTYEAKTDRANGRKLGCLRPLIFPQSLHLLCARMYVRMCLTLRIK